MTDERRISKELCRTPQWSLRYIIPEFVWKDWGTPREILVTAADVPVEFRTDTIPNTSLEHYRYINLNANSGMIFVFEVSYRIIEIPFFFEWESETESTSTASVSQPDKPQIRRKSPATKFTCWVPLSYPVTGAEMLCYLLSDYTAILHCDMFLFTTYRAVVTTIPLFYTMFRLQILSIRLFY
jgi:hypothetical protein